jgi:hypothetical protein
MVGDDFISVGAPLPRILSVRPLPDRRAHVVWAGGSEQAIDLAPAIMSHRGFIPLRSDDALFAQMAVSETFDSIIWPNGLELSAVWIEELAPVTLDNAAFRQAMDELRFSLDGMAARLGVARRLVADYRKDKPIPQLVALATRYLMERHRRLG